MSGTSLDGVDAAAIRTNGRQLLGFGQTEFRAYSAQERDTIRGAFGMQLDSETVHFASHVVTQAHIEILQRFELEAVVGFHGQTLTHDPAQHFTHQTGSPHELAKSLSRTVVGDFRTKDMAEGGQGAPLAPFYHFALAQYLGLATPVLFINLGGVGNLSWVDPRQTEPESPNALIAFDTGPANAPINDLMSEQFRLTHDVDGKLAACGRVCPDTVRTFLTNPYFKLPPPKSLDRNHFAELAQLTKGLDAGDSAATLTACAAQAIAAALDHLPATPSLALICGGGRRNPTLMAMLDEAIPVAVKDIDDFGIDGDMLEAQAFGHLAVRVLRGLPNSSPSTTGCRQPVSGGQVFQ